MDITCTTLLCQIIAMGSTLVCWLSWSWPQSFICVSNHGYDTRDVVCLYVDPWSTLPWCRLWCEVCAWSVVSHIPSHSVLGPRTRHRIITITIDHDNILIDSTELLIHDCQHIKYSIRNRRTCLNNLSENEMCKTEISHLVSFAPYGRKQEY